MSITAVLFDRDGTLIEDRHYLASPEGVVLLPGVGEALFRLSRNGVRLFMASNQSGIGRGYFSREDAEACNYRVQELLAGYGTGLEDMLYCPHAPEMSCTCRKPAPGMWKELCARVSRYAPLRAESTVMVGDKAADILFASRAGLFGGILVLTGKGEATCEKLGLEVPARFHLFPEENRPGYPMAVVRDFSFLVEALDEIDRAGTEAESCDA